MVLTKEQYKEFVKLYKQAVKNNTKTFVFYGQILLTEYAKHLLTYYELQNDKLQHDE